MKKNPIFSLAKNQKEKYYKEDFSRKRS